ncbi:MAG: nucleotidyltransferase domain-containing protein [Candidatus Bipolaricaulota bacterium]|nr:nucleotidyltransferase domain-containing protein [Candidatus Bipolaricaulota bacterium]
MDLTKLEEKLVQYAREHQVSALYLFGSVVHGALTPLSDLDVAVFLPESVPSEEYFDRRLQMTLDLMELLRASEIDLVILNHAPPLLKYKVVTTGKLLYSRDERALNRFELRVLTEYLDFKPVLDMQFEYLQRRLKEGQFGVRQSYRPRTLEKA